MSKPSFLDKEKIPHCPGVYLYKNREGKIIYVGKAVDLYHRVSSYFQKVHPDPKTKALVENIAEIKTIKVSSELEALILEANLIKKYLPKFNIRLTDDKDYLYIKVTKEDYPKIVTARKQDLADAQDFFGPFPSAKTVKATIKKLRRFFPWCNNPPKSKKQKLKACFYYHLGLCPGVCLGKIPREDYLNIIDKFCQFMEGRSEKVLRSFSKEMEKASRDLDFEKASQIKKTLIGLNYILSGTEVKSYLETPNFWENQNLSSLEALKKDLALSKRPERIECFDISHLAGGEAVGSLVVLEQGEINKKWYRRFKIKFTKGVNDVGMMKEVIFRRLKHEEWPKPNLILVDGGKGQLKVGTLALKEAGWEVPIFALAKRLEWIYGRDNLILKLPKASLSLRLLQKVRDEAHRFALNYHRHLRKQNRLVI